MGKYIKYFKTTAEFAEYWNFADFAPGPDEGDDTTMVAYVTESDKVYYYNSDMSEFEVNFSAQSSEIDATADTVTFNVKTGLFWLDVYRNGEFVDTYRPAVDKSVRFEVAENLSPLTVTENFVGKWYKDNDGEKGDYITESPQPITHNPDPNADPVKLQCYVGFESDGQSPTRLGNGPLTGATRVYYEDETLGTDVDILNDIYIQSKRAWYQFSAQGEYNVCFEFESDNQEVGDYFIYSQGKYLDIYTNYPELAEQTNFRFSGPLMQSTIEELTIGEGMLSVNGFLMANSLNHIILEDQNKLPVLNGGILGVAAEGTVEAQSRDVENFSMWENNLPSGWTMLPEPSPEPGLETKGQVTVWVNASAFDTKVLGNAELTDEFSMPEVYDENDEQLDLADFNLTIDSVGNQTTITVPKGMGGTFKFVFTRTSADLLCQGWFAGGEFYKFKYDEIDFAGGVHISLYGGALSGCTNLETVELGENCTGVSLKAFDGCSNLTEIICHPATEISLTDLSAVQFSTITQNTGTLEIPSGSSYSNWEAALGNNWTVVDDL